MKALLVDNRDSFTWNLEHLLAGLGVDVEVRRYGPGALADPGAAELLVISPGPGRPEDYPEYRALEGWRGPVLGICLGMQVLSALDGGTTARLPGCVHGKADVVADLWGRAWVVGRYHSLWCETLGEGWDVLGRNPAGVPMAIVHRGLPR
ncbi:MAG: aminodeoxychorismate/anthranilate synthase component II, partial [Deltaproteobacteria bacterium]|nr:aminodeoxychorismate/anthranilate synthase component II [Deltaproteobacteria bacterium]